MKHSNRTGIWIPREIECLDQLTVTEKYLLSEIRSLTLARGCFASNAYFATLLKKKPDTISKMITKLKRLNFISQKSFDGRRRELSYCLGLKSESKPKENPTCLPQKSYADTHLSEVAFISNTTKINNKITKNPLDVWKEFLKWTNELAPTTRIRIQSASGPESLAKQDRIFWENFSVRMRPLFGS
ncbi:helix-turn-helix domain-containing protein [Leptospira biflexa]|uniref:helix-turn-helix domain-containing protein n=1 Tax=Leptospira biflexa TaxID=172 RepID=UPI0010913894|nr:helix-turn-helix domain-containing protein [Leptospira biflexa]TGM41715.1 helix-turn-helix domain-containing protein [Leptospira biflexa]TGM43871.1 helix-turn-helix domain-containing protein [Leptospira biflexa]